jgi:hypothetical protein
MLSARTRNGYYARLGLGPGQRFASKGGYLVHFADAQGAKIVADGAWVVPEALPGIARAAVPIPENR